MSIFGAIDLRSDTVTQPTEAMRRAMAAAEVGDDQYREDPTVTRLEERAAELFGKEAALFVSSGTMGNLVALLAHCGRGDEAILGDQSHILWYEGGGAAALGGIVFNVRPNAPTGEIDLDDAGFRHPRRDRGLPGDEGDRGRGHPQPLRRHGPLA